jgi:5-methylcytosine-specific restriction endonuclease McrA
MRDACAGRDRPRCTYCGVPMSRRVGVPGSPPVLMGGTLTYPFTEDHIVPRAMGGNGAKANRTACCGPCNGQKASQPLVQFIAQLGDRAAISMGEAQRLQDRAMEACGQRIGGLNGRPVLR